MIFRSFQITRLCMKTCKMCCKDKPLTDYYKWTAKCKSCYNEIRRKRYNSNPEFRKKRARQIQDRKEVRRKEDSLYDLHKRISRMIRNRISSKKLLSEYGIDVESILSSIGERPNGNYHLDHIFPQVAFDYENSFEVWACNHQRNLRWLPANENISKRDKYDSKSFSEYISEMRVIWNASRNMRNGYRSE
jgi:hypothetical protein